MIVGPLPWQGRKPSLSDDRADGKLASLAMRVGGLPDPISDDAAYPALAKRVWVAKLMGRDA